MSAGADVEDLLRAMAPQVLGVLARRCGDFAAAEDAVQEALLAAALHWPDEGVPDNPRGWLVQTATRRLTDAWRSDSARRRREQTTFLADLRGADVPDRDDTLTLLFLCCHPVLTPVSAVALTLRAVGGLSTAEIARAFLVPEATMAQRISRAKQRIRDAGGRFTMPAPAERGHRLRLVLRVLYLVFNEGYTATSGSSVYRTALSVEAIRVTRLVHGALPDDPEVTGLLALMLLTDARRPARADPDGRLVPLAEQDRSLWDRRAIVEATRLLAEALSAGALGEYQLQAAIAAAHDHAARADDTDWEQILALYTVLERVTGSPVVSLNRAVAAAMVHGPEHGLALLEGLEAPLAGHHRLAATRAHLLERAGSSEAAAAEYARAASLTSSLPEQQYLTERSARLRSG